MIPRNSKGLAVKIHQRLGAQLRIACAGTVVPPSFLAGLISAENEAVDTHATRFEPLVYKRLRKVRDGWIRRIWNGVAKADLKGKTDSELIDLATSFGYTQIMGWQSLRLNCTIRDLQDPWHHLSIAVRLLQRVAGMSIVAGRFDDVLRIWHTGSPHGQTFDPQYVANALAVMKIYQAYLGAAAGASPVVPPRTTPDAPAAASFARLSAGNISNSNQAPPPPRVSDDSAEPRGG